jgi:glycosyltransferase 2 family protein
LADAPEPVGSAPTALLTRWLPRLILLVVLAVAGYLIANNYSGLRSAVSTMGVAAIVESLLLAVCGTAAIGQIWTSVLRGLGARVATGEALGVFFVSQLGKYLPGSVWPVLAQMEFGRRAGTPRRTMLAANLLMLAIVTATGLITGAALLPWSSADGLHRYWWTLLLLVPLLVSLHPRVIPAVLDRLFVLLRRPPLGLRVTNRAMITACLWGFAVWALLGVHLLVMTRTLGAGGGESIAAAIGGMGLAFAVGLIVIPVPAGAGIRDGVLIATFATEIGHTAAIAVALASRVLLVLADVGLAGLGAVLGRRARLDRAPVSEL